MSKKHFKFENQTALIDKIANIVVEKISGSANEASTSVDLTPTSPIIESSSANNLNLSNYDNVLKKSDESDDFDENRLLKLVPNNHHKKAKELLQKINENGHLITFNSSGLLFIDGLSVPNSNMFEIFPMLFRITKPKNIPGLLEIIKQIELMKLSNLITTKLKNQTQKLASEEKVKISDNYWYLG